MRFFGGTPNLSHISTAVTLSGKPLDELRQQRAIHRITPWFQSPLHGREGQDGVFAQRHEANTLELFFDLFFVANLATFTAYHSINNVKGLASYIGFFGIIWLTWFQITMHDVRFGRDTLFERACKAVQMVVFVAFSLVGSDFEPGSEKGNNMNFRLLCWTLAISRGLLALQYLVVLWYCWRAKQRDIIVPLILNVSIYILAIIAFTAMTVGFPKGKPVLYEDVELPVPGLVSVWWVIMGLESFSTIAVAMIWRKLSFKKTHLVERLGLLTLIVIGEGAIGVTKTITKMMGKDGLDGESCGLIFCIILLLLLLWMLYFDNQPHGHYGTIRQQIWAIMHFVVHLSIVGAVEGAQQIALARYVERKTADMFYYVDKICAGQNLDGEELTQALIDLGNKYKLTKKPEARILFGYMIESAQALGNITGVCSPEATVHFDPLDWENLPPDLFAYELNFASAIYASLGVELEYEKDELPIVTAVNSYTVVYLYFWGSLLLLTLCGMVTLFLTRKSKKDIQYWTSHGIRLATILVMIGMLAGAASNDFLTTMVSSTAILPIAVGLLLATIFADRIGTAAANHFNRTSGEPLIDETHEHEHEHHGHEGENGDDHETKPLDYKSISNIEVSGHSA